jgi:hypothetical protein
MEGLKITNLIVEGAHTPGSCNVMRKPPSKHPVLWTRDKSQTLIIDEGSHIDFFLNKKGLDGNMPL